MTDDPRIGALADAVRDLRRDLDSLTAVVEKTAAAFAALLTKLDQREEYEQEQREREG